MDALIALLAEFFAWLGSQTIPVRVIVGLGVLAGLYPLLVVLRVLVVALYGAFRGLG
jgi:hypothetical protein